MKKSIEEQSILVVRSVPFLQSAQGLARRQLQNQ